VNRLQARVPRVFLALGGLLLAYCLLPLLCFAPRFSAAWAGGWGSEELRRALFVSAFTATTATFLLAALGIPLAYVLARRDFPGKTFAGLLVQVPLALPPVVSGILLLMTFGPYTALGALAARLGLRLTDSLAGIILAQMFVASPFLVIAARSAFEAVDPELEAVAATLGKSGWETLRRVTLPLAWPGILAGTALCWVRALGEFGATDVMAYHPYSLPVLTWVEFSGSGLSGALPLALVQLSLGAAGLLLAFRFARWRIGPAETGDAPAPAPSGAPRRAGTGGEAARPSFDVRVNLALGDFRLDARFVSRRGRVAVLGPSGSGKSLLLKTLAGLLKPDGGAVSVSGRAVFDSAAGTWVPPERRGFGYVPQNLALFPHMTVWEHVLFAFEPGARDPDAASRALRRLGLEGLWKRTPAQLSYGQQQRVALARALVREPRVLLLDEPFASLDSHLRLRLRRELLGVLSTLDAGVLLVTHDAEEAYELAEEVVVLSAGAVVQHGTREEVFAAPRSPLAAELLGLRNVFSGRVISSGPRGLTIRYQDAALTAPPGSQAPSADVGFFVSPRRLSLRETAEPLATGTVLRGEIESVYPTASGSRLVVAIGEGELREFWEIEEQEAAAGRARGERVNVFVPASAVRVVGA